jgi:hypothetical protein
VQPAIGVPLAHRRRQREVLAAAPAGARHSAVTIDVDGELLSHRCFALRAPVAPPDNPGSDAAN